MSRVSLDWKGLGAVVLWDAGVYRDDHGLVRVPYRLPGGAVHNEKVFGHGRSWWAIKGLQLLPFGLERVPDACWRKRRLLWVAEGESDALCLREHYPDWRGRCVDVLGLPGASTWRQEWSAYVDGYDGLYVFPDGDLAGERMAQAVSATVLWAIAVYMPPGRDVRDVLQSDGSDALEELIVCAERVELMLAAMRRCRTIDQVEAFLREVT